MKKKQKSVSRRLVALFGFIGFLLGTSVTTFGFSMYALQKAKPTVPVLEVGQCYVWAGKAVKIYYVGEFSVAGREYDCSSVTITAKAEFLKVFSRIDCEPTFFQECK